MSRTIIVGAPGSGKRKLAGLVRDKLPHLEVQREPGHTHPDAALGTLADYRTELSLALDRTWFAVKDHTISTHSLIDNITYTLLRAEAVIEYLDPQADLWVMCVGLITQLAQDSFQYDNIFFLPGSTQETAYIEETLAEQLELFELPYVELSGNLEEDAKTIVEVISGQRTDTQKS